MSERESESEKEKGGESEKEKGVRVLCVAICTALHQPFDYTKVRAHTH